MKSFTSNIRYDDCLKRTVELKRNEWNAKDSEMNVDLESAMVRIKAVHREIITIKVSILPSGFFSTVHALYRIINATNWTLQCLKFIRYVSECKVPESDVSHLKSNRIIVRWWLLFYEKYTNFSERNYSEFAIDRSETTERKHYMGCKAQNGSSKRKTSEKKVFQSNSVPIAKRFVDIGIASLLLGYALCSILIRIFINFYRLIFGGLQSPKATINAIRKLVHSKLFIDFFDALGMHCASIISESMKQSNSVKTGIGVNHR